MPTLTRPKIHVESLDRTRIAKQRGRNSAIASATERGVPKSPTIAFGVTCERMAWYWLPEKKVVNSSGVICFAQLVFVEDFGSRVSQLLYDPLGVLAGPL